ncbi:unnamed protein product [Auanema sp. JU1783]|nr:unnamed protein product [Auanema sp. JU1783]
MSTAVEDLCGLYEGYTMQRFIIITFFSVISVFGIAGNALLMAVFWKTLPSSVYLATLSTLDMLICLTYLLLFGVDAGFVYLKDKTLFFLYHRYIIPVFFVAKVVQFAIPFSLILITLERYLWTTKEKTRLFFAPVFSDKGRCVTAAFIILVSMLLRMPVLLSTQVQQYPGCTDYFRSESVSQAEWASESYAYYFFDFHVITAVQMCFPFIVLLILNIIIIKRLLAEKREHMYASIKPRLSNFAGYKSPHQVENGGAPPTMSENYVLLEVATEVMKESLIHRSSRDKQSQLRNAIYTMLAIVMSYLVCNGVHLFLTVLERFDSSILYDSDDPNQSSNFYIALSDTVSICYMVSSAARLIIYCKCNPKLRKEIRQYLTERKKNVETS